MSGKIHVAFGFHVNCYHSYRGDTNDNLGFGSDIRIIGKIIEVLNACNADGIPVKGTWDSENFFSLEQILPRYAPDIIEGMRERVKKHGDENIIMGYSNGALGAMNEAELTASIELAVTNEQKSGLQDIFGECEKIVRPQEVMFSPSQVSVYNKLGVKALCLYYSCVPFDAFRTLVPPLCDEYAFNPLTYSYKGESITVLPTYSNSDVCDAGCLRAWVKSLHEKQINSEIENDLFLFINMDADAVFWETMNLPLVKNKIANTDGIHGLIYEIADLDYIVFDTPGGYLKNHKPLGSIEFTADTADGNFTGFASWSEKPYNRKIWTAIERSRTMSKANSSDERSSASFSDRVKLLSTTHFGLATPVLNIQREKKADELAQSIIVSESVATADTETLNIINTSGTDLQCLQLKVNAPVKSASLLSLEGSALKDYCIVPFAKEPLSVFCLLRFNKICPKYELKVTLKTDAAPPENKSILTLTAGKSILRFTNKGRLLSFLYNGKTLGGNSFLESFITYNNKKYNFVHTGITSLDICGSGTGVHTFGEICLPGEQEKGSFSFDFFTFEGSDTVYVKTDVKYPYTPENTSISTENSSLGRFSDMKWLEAVPFQLTPKLKGDISVIKRNFMGDISTFRTALFGECDPENKALDSFNHQLSAGVVGLTDNNTGLLVVNARNVLNSMAHCPMRLDSDGTVHMNPFGTYYGSQRHHFSRSNDEILNVYTLVTPQGKSIAPSYNGNRETAMLALVPFEGALPENGVLSDVLSFADGAIATESSENILVPFLSDNVTIKTVKADGIDEKKLRNPMLSGLSGNLGKYITKGSRAVLHIVKAQIKAK